MAVDQKILSGVMDKDSPYEIIGGPMHRDALNIDWRGISGNQRPEGTLGNTLLANPLLPAVGQNLNLSRYYDGVKKRIFIFNYNSEGAHGIYLFNTVPQSFERLVEIGPDTDGDILHFEADKFICNVSIIYGDNVQGDILYWLNCQGKPSKINVDRARASEYATPFLESFMDVAKEPAVAVPSVVYENDATITVNNLRKRLFKFKIRYWFDDQDKSVTSIQSEIPVPFWPFDPDVDSNPAKNSRIAIVYETGASNVKKVEILGAVSTGNAFSDFFLIEAIDKGANNIPDNDIAVYNFYNDKAYDYIDVEESIQIFDYVPLSAVSQEILNGNVLLYGNITEGYPNITNFSNGVDTTNITSDSTDFFEGVYFATITASQSGRQAFGEGRIHVIVKGEVVAVNRYRIKIVGLPTIQYSAIFGDDIHDVMQGLINAAMVLGYTITGSASDPDFVFFEKDGSVLAGVEVSTTNQNLSSTRYGSIPAYDWWSRLGFGLVYFDDKGRTNGVVTTDGLLVSTDPYSESGGEVALLPFFTLSIFHRPPEWATNYSIVRTRNLTKSKFVQWISVRTLKEISVVLSNSYAYISLESLNLFKSKNPQSPLTYTFAPQDRIRFMKRYTVSGDTANIYTNKDFEIISQEINPNINGVVYEGQFVKIILPTTDSSFDFGAPGFDYYFIELYSPAQPVANDLNVYYEFGERYLIGNPYLSTRFHQGYNQNQSTDLITPAVIELMNGDNYYRERTIELGTEILYEIQEGFGPDSDAGRITLGCAFISQDISDPNVIPSSSPFNNLIGFDLATNTDRQILTIGTGSYQFRITGTISINFRDVGPDEYPYEFFLQKNDGTKYSLTPVFDAHNPGTYTFDVDTIFTMSTGQRIFIFGWSVFGNDNTRSFNTTNLTITRILAFRQSCIDPNFSDYYPSAVNPNGRAFATEPQAATVNYPVLYRWGLLYQRDTNINQTNRFYFQNSDEADRGYGAIMRFGYFEKMLRVFQERKVGVTGVYQRFITDANGSNALITTSDIITRNNIQYYVGDWGIGNQPDSLVASGYRHYFVDPVRGVICRVSMDGVEAISIVFHNQTFVGPLATKYLRDYDYPLGGKSRISGVFHVRKDNTPQYLCAFQGGTRDEEELTPQSIIFSEDQKGFTGRYGFTGDSMVCAENDLYSFLGGELYIHNNSTNYCNFYGAQQQPSIILVFNNQINIKKEFNAISYRGNQIWVSDVTGDIFTSMVNPQTGLQQLSQLKAVDYIVEDGVRYAAFFRDVNSMDDPQEALVEGDYLTGDYIVVKLTYKGTGFSFLFEPYITWQVNNRNY